MSSDRAMKAVVQSQQRLSRSRANGDEEWMIRLYERFALAAFRLYTDPYRTKGIQ